VLGTVLARTLPEGRRSLAKCGEMRGLVLSRSVGEIFSCFSSGTFTGLILCTGNLQIRCVRQS
jgi:hypothetical protein